MVGADVVMMTSALLRHGPEHVTTVEAGPARLAHRARVQLGRPAARQRERRDGRGSGRVRAGQLHGHDPVVDDAAGAHPVLIGSSVVARVIVASIVLSPSSARKNAVPIVRSAQPPGALRAVLRRPRPAGRRGGSRRRSAKNASPATTWIAAVGSASANAEPSRTEPAWTSSVAMRDGDEDGQRPVARREGERHELALVSELGEEDDAEREGERVHDRQLKPTVRATRPPACRSCRTRPSTSAVAIVYSVMIVTKFDGVAAVEPEARLEHACTRCPRRPSRSATARSSRPTASPVRPA